MKRELFISVTRIGKLVSFSFVTENGASPSTTPTPPVVKTSTDQKSVSVCLIMSRLKKFKIFSWYVWFFIKLKYENWGKFQHKE